MQLMLRYRPGQRRQIGQRRVIKQFTADFDPVSARLLDYWQQRSLTAESGNLRVAISGGHHDNVRFHVLLHGRALPITNRKTLNGTGSKAKQQTVKL
jgi:hypothetical protein